MYKRTFLSILIAICLIAFAQTAFADTEAPIVSTTLYADVNSRNEHYKAIAALTERGIIQGSEDAEFNGDEPATHAMMWVMLARLSGEEIAEGDTWYSSAWRWCHSNGIVSKKTPNTAITGSAALDMLFNFAGYYGAVASKPLYAAGAYSPNYMTSGEWAEYIGLDMAADDTELTRNDVAELLNDFSQYLQSLTYEELATMLCDAYGVKTNSLCSSIYIAVNEGLLSIEDILESGQTLSSTLYLPVSPEYFLKILSDLCGMDFQDIVPEEIRNTETVSDDYAQSLIDEYCTGTGENNEHPNLNEFFSIDERCTMCETTAGFNTAMCRMFYCLDNIPQFILLHFIENGWRLVITDMPTNYASGELYVHAHQFVTGLCSYDNKTIAIKSGFSPYEHEFGHYATYVLTDGFSDINKYTQKLEKAYQKEKNAFALGADNIHFGDNYQELAAEVFSLILRDNEEDVTMAKKTAPTMCELIRYVLDETNWQ